MIDFVVLLKSPVSFPILYYFKMGMMSSLRMMGLEKVSYWMVSVVFGRCADTYAYVCASMGDGEAGRGCGFTNDWDSWGTVAGCWLPR